MGEYFDISPPISSLTAVFPGDQPFERRIALSFAGGDHLELSSMLTTLHLGAHADAPSHYLAKGADIASRGLGGYLGACEVKHVLHLPRHSRIEVADLSQWRPRAKKVLFRTDSYPDPNHWSGGFNSLSPGLIHFLAECDVSTVGLDTPSIDPEDSKILESHAAVATHDMSVLEGLVLSQVPEGIYYLIALPLRLVGCDASPVRAILLKSSNLTHW